MPRDSTLSALSGAILLVGLVILIPLGALWPWFLAVIGLAILPRTAQLRGVLAGLLASGMLVALAAMIATDTIWPGVLALVGISVALRLVVRRR